jgi:hypothetical protein
MLERPEQHAPVHAYMFSRRCLAEHMRALQVMEFVARVFARGA